MALTLTSSAFTPGGVIPIRHSCEGADESPALMWGDPPDGTRSLVLICDDPDAPRGVWVHWVMYNIPPRVRGLPQGIQRDPQLPDGSRQGNNSSGRSGYSGPCPPPGHGPHRYFFKLYALDTMLDLPPGATKDELVEAMDGHILDQAETMGRFERKTRR